jgi:hypothetical protein
MKEKAVSRWRLHQEPEFLEGWKSEEGPSYTKVHVLERRGSLCAYELRYRVRCGGKTIRLAVRRLPGGTWEDV